MLPFAISGILGTLWRSPGEATPKRRLSHGVGGSEHCEDGGALQERTKGFEGRKFYKSGTPAAWGLIFANREPEAVLLHLLTGKNTREPPSGR